MSMFEYGQAGIWHDSEAYMGRGVKDPDGEVEVKEKYYGCTNKREIPCDACPKYKFCLQTGSECEAIRMWYSKGNYEDKDLMKKLKRG